MKTNLAPQIPRIHPLTRVQLNTNALYAFCSAPSAWKPTPDRRPHPIFSNPDAAAGEHDQAGIRAKGERVEDAFQTDGKHLQLPEILQNAGRRGALAVRGAVKGSESLDPLLCVGDRTVRFFFSKCWLFSRTRTSHGERKHGSVRSVYFQTCVRKSLQRLGRARSESMRFPAILLPVRVLTTSCLRAVPSPKIRPWICLRAKTSASWCAASTAWEALCS